ncbi:putative late blight resistance protein homolog R1A-3 isoform X2 [Nicotiana tomentosiformis]|uniref:Late blight resistance protein homolog R1B-16 n=1 Tax=Nicotiana tabacum TaxID=4097 RepID=A0A1S4CGR8_TOBAC|nr:PREDICTED: putative late blight resistance protein homolog R1B-16 [Nicotiana tabacum]
MWNLIGTLIDYTIAAHFRVRACYLSALLFPYLPLKGHNWNRTDMAYPSIASLMRTIKSLLTSNSPVQSIICNHREEILALHEKVSSLEVFLKNFEKSNASRKMTDLEAQIKEVVNVVEHTIQLRITEMVVANDEIQEEKAHKRFCYSLQQVAQHIDRVLNESSKDMVGRADQRKRLLDDLTRGFNDEPKVIPIVGMGGIGKTTLAKDVFDDVTIRSHFDVRAWATISKEHNVKDILVSLLRSTKEKDGIIHIEDETELPLMLQKSLKGKRYLIVLDDIWKNEAWDDVRLCFPSENKGSRILLTTRNIEVACSAGTENLSLRLDFMNPDESWNLFKSIIPANEALPSEFETVGKQIVEKCQGLPLTTVVVAGLLSKCKRTIEVWKNVAKDVKSFVKNDRDKQCQHVLGLSYNHLTSDLKPCLLYFGIFPEDSEISVKRLVRLWTAEGFLKSEEEAEKCLQELIDRCLVLVSRKSRYETKIRSCKVHDLIYELCLREAEKRTFFVINDIVFNDEPNHVPYHHLNRHKMRRFMGWTDDILRRGSYRALLTPRHRRKTDDDDNNSLKRTRSIFSFCRDSSTFTLKSELTHFNLIRILDLSCIKINIFPPQILCLIWLRYLVLHSRRGVFNIPPEISRLWNLQTFIVGGYHLTSTILPEQIWGLMQLRHLELSSFHLPNPPIVSVEEEKCLDFSNLHTISGLSLSCCTKEVISGIRNVRKLRINRGDEYESFQACRLFDNFVHLHQLETLSLELEFRGVLDEISPATIPSIKSFPPMLKKLKLYGTDLRWEDLNIIGELPNLEILKLKRYACRGEEWHPTEKGFTQLKLLLIEYNDLKYWNSPNDNFPVLERLVIRDCSELEDIPIDFAYIDSLQQIELTDCTPELEASAARIQHEQEENLGKKPVDVLISSGAHSAAKAEEEEDGEEEEEDEL